MKTIEETPIYKYAIRLLAPRDYSRHKLKEKLLSREFDFDQIDLVLDTLEEKEYLNEERYTKSKIRGYIFRKKGPEYIKQKLKVEKIENISAYIDDVVRENEINWQAMVSEVVEKETKNKELTYQLRNKVFRKLVSRGFSFEIINSVLNSH